jgi:hypothetical protein
MQQAKQVYVSPDHRNVSTNPGITMAVRTRNCQAFGHVVCWILFPLVVSTFHFLMIRHPNMPKLIGRSQNASATPFLVLDDCEL